jgi:hypothetical protein
MTSSTPGPDENPPRWDAPQGSQPGWNAPPPPPGYAPTPSYSDGSGVARRPGQVTAAAVIGIVIGGLGTLGGLLLLFALPAIFEISAFYGLMSLLSLAAAVMLLVGGIQVLTGKSPRLLLLGGYVNIAVQLIYTIAAVAYGEPWFTGLLGFVLPVLIVVFLRQQSARQYFASRGIAY